MSLTESLIKWMSALLELGYVYSDMPYGATEFCIEISLPQI